MQRAIKENVQKGTLLLHTWGCTMRHNDFFQVIEVKGSRVKLGIPKCKSEGNQDGYQWIEASEENPAYVRNAKFTKSGLQLCRKRERTDAEGKSQEWKIESGWSSLYVQPIGQKEHFYGD